MAAKKKKKTKITAQPKPKAKAKAKIKKKVTPKPETKAARQPKKKAARKAKAKAKARTKASANANANANANVPSVFTDLFARIDTIDWVEISNGSDGATFPRDLRRYLAAKKTPKAQRDALTTIWDKLVDRPIGALAAKFLIELLANPDDAGDVPYLCRLLVALVTHDHRRWLDGPFAAEHAGFMFSRLNKWSALAERRDILFKLLAHDDETFRAHAAFVLAWFGRAYSGTIVPALTERSANDPSPLVRASALLALGMHGEPLPFETQAHDSDPRIVLASAIAATFAPSFESHDDATAAIDRLGYALVTRVHWPEMPFCDGDLSAFAVKRLIQLSADRFIAHVRPWIIAELDRCEEKDSTTSALAEEIAIQLIERTFAQGEPTLPITDTKREVLRAIVDHPKTHTVACTALANAGFLLGGSTLVNHQINIVRRLAGLPRPKPQRPPFAEVTYEGDTRYAQHWISDFSEGDIAASSSADATRALARSIASQVPAADLIELLLMSSDLETDIYDATNDAPFDVPLPEGTLVASPQRKLVLAHEGWPDRAREYLARLKSDGWTITSEWWFGVSLRAALHREGHSLFFEMGNDWNQGNPIYTEAGFTWRRRFSIAPIIAAEALDHCADFERALADRVAKNPKGQQGLGWASRLTNIVLWTWATRRAVPPEEMDAAPVTMQAYWSYVQGPFRVYVDLLDDAERREQLILNVFDESKERCPALYALAPTPKIKKGLKSSVMGKFELKRLAQERDKALTFWTRDFGDRAESLISDLLD